VRARKWPFLGNIEVNQEKRQGRWLISLKRSISTLQITYFIAVREVLSE
jgi:hypothetical protein